MHEVKDRINTFGKKVIVFCITLFYKPTHWYAIAYKITRFLILFKWKRTEQSYGLSCAVFLNSLLSYLTRKKIPFQIPIEASGFEIFKKNRPKGLVICSLHMPLTKVSVRYMLENDFKPNAAVVSDHRGITRLSLWGTTETIGVIPTGRMVLVNAKNILNKGGSVVVLVDQVLGSKVSPNIFLLAHKLKADVVYFYAELMPDGRVAVSFYESSIFNSDKALAADLQIKELEGYAQVILNRYKNCN